jgi:methionine-rich copper-binding protein CopC
MRTCLPGHHAGRKRIAALLAGTSVALAGSALLGSMAAQASLTGPGVGSGKNITVFHDSDFVAVYGYEPGTPLVVEVLRGDSVIGRASGPSLALPDGAGLEINHGLEAVAPQPGDCWDVQTPDIKPGDRIVVTAAGDTDEVTVDDIRWTGTPALDATTGDVVVEGRARYADGTAIPLSDLQADEFRNATGKYRITPTLTATGTDGRFQVRYQAPYTGDRNRENLTQTQRQAVLLGNGHTVGFGHAEIPPAETQLVSGPAETPGPAVGCEGAPAGGGTPLPPRETTPPTVAPLEPADGATGVSRTGNITAQFDEAVSGVDGASFWLSDSDGRGYVTAVTYDPATRVATLNPSGSLTAGKVHTATVTSAVTDVSGNALAPTSWTFTTAAATPPADTSRPTVTARTPADNASGVSPDSAVTATFSEAVLGVDGTSFSLRSSDGSIVPTEWAYDSLGRVAMLDPATPLQAGTTYTASLTGSVRDAAANTLTPTSWTFTTAAAAGPNEPPADTVSPSVTDHTPAHGATGTPVAARITATFSEDVTGVDGSSVTLAGPGGPVQAIVGYDSATRKATLDPNADLVAGASYTATVSAGVKDAAGNALQSTSWTFGTVAAADTVRPTVTNKTPAANATGVARDATITAAFSEAVTGVSGSTVTLRAANRSVAATVSYDAATRVATLDPTAQLAAGTTYTATISSGVVDAARNTLAATSWTFTTAAPDTAPPSVTGRTPATGATGVSLDAAVTVTFSEPVTGVTGTALTLRTSNGALVPAAVGYDAATRTATLDPNATLASGARYTVGISNSVRDAAGNRLATTSWVFTTIAAPDTIRPTVGSRTPAAGATNVRRGNDLTIAFSEPVVGVSGTTVTLRTATGTVVPASVGYNAATRVVTLNPSSTLLASQRYQVSLTEDIRDAAGNRLTATSWTFTTGR